jgi:hypothetical protein
MVYRVGLRQFANLRKSEFFLAFLRLNLCLLVVGVVYVNTRVNITTTPSSALLGVQAATQRGMNHTTKGNKSGSAHGSATKNTSGKPSSLATPTAGTSVLASSCAGGSVMHTGLSSAVSAQLRKLAQYEQLCKSGVADRASFFVPTPTTATEARLYAEDAASQLNEFAKFGIKPLVFMEPNDDTGLLDLQLYQAGAYDLALETYYSRLLALGVTDTSMGTWVLLPEGNLPEWSSVDPNIYASVVTRTAQLQKKYFPASRVSLMLDSESYPSANSWSGGAYVSLLPYVQNIPRGLVDSFGLQGFPWAAPAGQSGSIYDSAVYLRTDLAIQATRSLGTSDLWVNTGTFRVMYAGQTGRMVSLSPLQRQAMLNGVLNQLRNAQSAGFTVSLHLFAENKANVSEGTDWSYWQAAPNEDTNTAVLTTLVHDARAAGIPLWLYDAVN